MICLKDEYLTLGTVQEKVTSWEVWFHTPWGLSRTLEHAVKACESQEIDPEQAIVPVPVAVGQTTYEAFFRG